jgi:hypothetical protein
VKRNLNYYTHDCTNHTEKGFRCLRAKYGWAGEGKFYALKNLIGKVDGCKLDITEDVDTGYYANILDFTLEEFKDYIDFAEKKCKLLCRVDNFIYCSDIMENLSQVMSKRKKARQKMESFRKQSGGFQQLGGSFR